MVPWPWQEPVEQPVSDPSSIIVLAHSRAVTGQADSRRRSAPPPTEASVKALLKDLAVSARVGYDMPVSAAEVAKVDTRPGPYRKLGRLSLPRIGLNVPFGEGVSAKTLDKGPGHWPGTPMPGRAGNAVLSGHRNTHTAPFKQLHLLRRGDKVVVTSQGRRAVTYRVKDTTIVRESKYRDFVLRQPEDADARTLTLFACHPAGRPVFRIVVRAEA